MDEPANRARGAAAASVEFRPLQKYLEGRFADVLVMTFSQIEDVLGAGLPARALSDGAWWSAPEGAGTPSPQASAWVHAKRTATVNLTARTVRFERSGP